jgi:hypothetical protein
MEHNAHSIAILPFYLFPFIGMKMANFIQRVISAVWNPVGKVLDWDSA